LVNSHAHKTSRALKQLTQIRTVALQRGSDKNPRVGALPDKALELRKAHQQRCDLALEPVRTRYLAELQRLMNRSSTEGKLPIALAAKRELELVKTGVAEFQHQPDLGSASIDETKPNGQEASPAIERVRD
jgi:hypothetical protein